MKIASDEIKRSLIDAEMMGHVCPSFCHERLLGNSIGHKRGNIEKDYLEHRMSLNKFVKKRKIRKEYADTALS